jgi:SNF2 family DNA or RNA helicase
MAPQDSGKFARLAEIAETLAAKQEKLLVFTQFRETHCAADGFPGNIFGREGLVLHGGTPMSKRRELVKRFQEDEQVPFFVLSLKAGGTGLNLTAATRVIHFDRWWNPAVENLATDRAWRTGQHRKVLVRKFVCRGTIEDRIDALIRSKQQLVKDVLEGDTEINLTEMSDLQVARAAEQMSRREVVIAREGETCDDKRFAALPCRLSSIRECRGRRLLLWAGLKICLSEPHCGKDSLRCCMLG